MTADTNQWIDERGAILTAVESRLDDHFDGENWTADYRRLRLRAVLAG